MGLFFLLCFVQLGTDCRADTNIAPKVIVPQDKVSAEDMEVIKNLDLLQEWDIVGPEGPDMDKLDVLNAKPLTGVGHDK